MREEIKTTIDTVLSHPKTAIALAGAFNFNAWYGTYEPIAKFATSFLGIILVSVLIVKHALDIKITLTSRNKKIDQDFELDRLKIEEIKSKNTSKKVKNAK